MFTSSVPREGKSTAAMLVAMTSGQMGKSTVIVDCDLRLPQLDNLVGAENHELGLMSVLEGRCEVDDAVYKDTATGVHVLTSAGKERSRHINAADVLSSRRFETLIETLSETYDFVVLDTPPTLVVADARIVARQADAVVYIVRWDDTPRGAVMEGLKVLRSIGAPISGVVMTQVKEGRVASYAYHGYNYYKGKYRAYYRN
jgi:capsular exopolysaccharide synthesis family protein